LGALDIETLKIVDQKTAALTVVEVNIHADMLANGDRGGVLHGL
jgi:hypothetical protein